MAEKSKIEWTDATWNPVTGCTRISKGCDNCYIERSIPFRTKRRRFDLPIIGGTTGVQLHPNRLVDPLKWRGPLRIFVNSLSDLFHAEVPEDYIAQVFAVMAATPQHTYQVLTKRHGRMRSLLSSNEFRLRTKDAHSEMQLTKVLPNQPLVINAWPLPNVWLGVSVEDQAAANLRIPKLLDTPARVRFLSCEPLLGPVQLRPDWMELELQAFGGRATLFPHISWVIVGGESGPGARPMHPAWARSLRDQCTKYGTPFHFKQWGAWAPLKQLPYDVSPTPNTATAVVAGKTVYRVGKRAAGRLLDGREWNDFPAVTP